MTRVASSFGIWNRENPHFEIDEQRVEWTARAERQFAAVFRDRRADLAEHRGLRHDRRSASGPSAPMRTFDTRHDPTFPRNAIVAGTGWTGLHVRGLDRIDLYTADLRGYLGVIGQAVLAGRVQYTAASDTLPSYERLLHRRRLDTARISRRHVRRRPIVCDFGGAAGTDTSVLSGARLGVTAFMDATKAYDVGVEAIGCGVAPGRGRRHLPDRHDPEDQRRRRPRSEERRYGGSRRHLLDGASAF